MKAIVCKCPCGAEVSATVGKTVVIPPGWCMIDFGRFTQWRCPQHAPATIVENLKG